MKESYCLTIIALQGNIEIEDNIITKTPQALNGFRGQSFDIFKQWITKQRNVIRLDKIEENLC